MKLIIGSLLVALSLSLALAESRERVKRALQRPSGGNLNKYHAEYLFFDSVFRAFDQSPKIGGSFLKDFEAAYDAGKANDFGTGKLVDWGRIGGLTKGYIGSLARIRQNLERLVQTQELKRANIKDLLEKAKSYLQIVENKRSTDIDKNAYKGQTDTQQSHQVANDVWSQFDDVFRGIDTNKKVLEQFRFGGRGRA